MNLIIKLVFFFLKVLDEKKIVESHYQILQQTKDETRYARGAQLKAESHRPTANNSSCSSNNGSHNMSKTSEANRSVNKDILPAKSSKPDVQNTPKENLRKSNKFAKELEAEKTYKTFKKVDMKNLKPASAATTSLVKSASSSSDKKFQRNTEHTQSIKIIKENFANLFLSKKNTVFGSKHDCQPTEDVSTAK